MQADIAEWKGKEVDRSEGGVTCQERGKREEGKMGTQKKKQGQREIGGGKMETEIHTQGTKTKGRQDGR